jgi:hypothetical protein
MKDLFSLKDKFVTLGMKESNIDYAIDAIEYGTEKELIIQNLTSVYRNETEENSNQLITEILDELKGPRKRVVKIPHYSALKQKIYNDYINSSDEKLMEIYNSGKYKTEVVDIITEILVERKLINRETFADETNSIAAEPEKKRNNVLTFYLNFMIIANGLASIINLFAFAKLKGKNTGEELLFFAFSVVCVLNIIFVMQILKWKKSGFNNLAYLAAIMFCINLFTGISLGSSILGLAGLFILYAFLQFEKDGKSAWVQLE